MNEEIIQDLRERMARVEERLKQISENELLHINDKIDAIHHIVERMGNRGTRMSNGNVALLVALASACVGLATAALR